MKKRTALQSVLDTLENDWSSPQPYIDLIKSAIEEERLQIINAFDDGSLNEYSYPSTGVNNGEEYYDKNYSGMV